VRKGFDGGAEAASLLAQDVQNYLGGIDPKAVQDTSCRILVCANVRQLEPLYSTSRTIEFIQGFNSNPLAKFVDVGGTRENAEAKLHGMYPACRQYLTC
jgi:hypothetical protein